ncbi:MAG: hypothetical protein LIP12_14750 [Clostridiales bacterium]|nr:hypothetical protein [Clostridiales bacterium]
MTSYKNSEGYSDPTAGEALGRIARDNRRAAKEKERLEARKRFECLCSLMKQLADESGFDFPGEIWLKDRKTGWIYKNKK